MPIGQLWCCTIFVIVCQCRHAVITAKFIKADSGASARTFCESNDKIIRRFTVLCGQLIASSRGCIGCMMCLIALQVWHHCLWGPTSQGWNGQLRFAVHFGWYSHLCGWVIVPTADAFRTNLVLYYAPFRLPLMTKYFADLSPQGTSVKYQS